MFVLDPTPCPPPTPTWMETAKIVGSTIAGMFATVIIAPILETIKRRAEIRRVEKAIQFDRLTIGIALEALKRGLVSSDDFWSSVAFPSHKYYWQKNRELFYGSLALQLIRSKCEEVKFIRNCVIAGKMTSDEGAVKLPTLLDAIQKAKVNIGESDLTLKSLKRRILPKRKT